MLYSPFGAALELKAARTIREPEEDEMPNISSAKLTPGMKLAEPVVNKEGLVLIGENTELTGALIEKILQMDIRAIRVHGAPKALPPKEEVLAQIERRFRSVETAEHMGVLKRLLTEHIEGLYEEHGSEDRKG
jgi:hypothetical protein